MVHFLKSIHERAETNTNYAQFNAATEILSRQIPEERLREADVVRIISDNYSAGKK
jgi:hypothetical protein